MTTRGTADTTGAPEVHRRAETRESTETKSAYKTTEFIVYVVAVAAILIAGLVVDGFNATETWRFFTFLTIGYMISRGLAKSGSREPYRD
ncbi:MAG: hypothetical protein M3R38_37465 [Actinomycetota bacterium]|nr:hypothetical protein [Actinomycetota bacterium]MDP9481295.1 hypothetical protein [Actinomycetota bacterium]